MPSAYQSRPYDDRYSSARMSDLMREAGNVQAQGIQQRGQAWAGTVGRMGDLVADVAGSYVAAKAQQKRDAKEQEADAKEKAVAAEQERIKQVVRESVDPATRRIDFGEAAKKIGQINPLEAEKFWNQATARQREDAARESEKAEQVARGLGAVLLTAQKDKEAGPGALQSTPPAYRTWRADALKRGLIDAEDFPEEYDEAAVQQQALFKYLPAAAVFNQLFAAKNAPQRSTKVVDGRLVDDQTGKVIFESPDAGKTTERPATATVDGRIVDLRTGKVIYTSPEAGKGGKGEPTPAQIQAAHDKRFDRTLDLRQRVDKGLPPEKAEMEAYEIEVDFARATGAPLPEPPRRMPADFVASGGTTSYEAAAQRNAGGGPSMRDIVQPAPTQRPQAPLGASPTAVAPASPGLKVRMRAPNGEIMRVPAAQVDAAIKAGATVVK